MRDAADYLSRIKALIVFFRVEEQVHVIKYSFHWQSPDGRLRKRWDNAADHPEVPTSPPHVHYDEETNVAPCEPVTTEEVLAIIAIEITNQEL